MNRLTVTLHDESKRNELVALVANLPYVRSVQIAEEDNDLVDDVAVLPLPKNGHDDFSATAHTGQMSLADPLDREVVLFEEQHGELVTQFLGQYIAMYEGKIIAHDADLDTLITQVYKTHPNAPVLFRLVQEALPPTIFFRSPRLEKR